MFLERIENKNGEAMLSREKAKREEAWAQLEKAFEKNERVTGVIFRAGQGWVHRRPLRRRRISAWQPGGHSPGARRRAAHGLAPTLPDPEDGTARAATSWYRRRAVLEETRAEQRSELIAGLKEGQVLQGVVKNITEYGAFVDLGGVDGLLHVTDISWKRINHPSESLSIGQQVDVQVIRFNAETQRISLGMKQLEADPLGGCRLEVSDRRQAEGDGSPTSPTYGAFRRAGGGHRRPGPCLGDELDQEERASGQDRLDQPGSRGHGARCRRAEAAHQPGPQAVLSNPWEAFVETYPTGSELEGEIKNITEFGCSSACPARSTAWCTCSDLDWKRSGEEAVKAYTKGDMLKVKILDVDVEKERISLGVKQLTDDPFGASLDTLKKGVIVTCTVHQVVDGGIEVTGRRRRRLDRLHPQGGIEPIDRSEQRPDRFAVGEKLDAKITTIDKKNRKISLSIKQREIEEEKQAMASYGSSDSGASLGDILGAAISKGGSGKGIPRTRTKRLTSLTMSLPKSLLRRVCRRVCLGGRK